MIRIRVDLSHTCILHLPPISSSCSQPISKHAYFPMPFFLVPHFSLPILFLSHLILQPCVLQIKLAKMATYISSIMHIRFYKSSKSKLHSILSILLYLSFLKHVFLSVIVCITIFHLRYMPLSFLIVALELRAEYIVLIL